VNRYEKALFLSDFISIRNMNIYISDNRFSAPSYEEIS